MFCSSCGAQIQGSFNACPNCGRAITQSSVPVQTMPASRLQHHLQILGTLWVIAGALFLIPGLILMTLSSFLRLSIPATENIGRLVAPLVLTVIGASLFVVAAAGIVVGWGLLKHQSWARIAAIVVGVISLLHPPFGTALGIYTLWVLLSDEGGVEYERLTQAV
jgi:hypothetical protein